MSEFWSYMAPVLIAAVSLPAMIALGLKLMPSDEWSARVIQEWADSEGLRVAAIDDTRWFHGLYRWSSLHEVYRVRVLDNKGRERECKAVVGHFLLSRTYKNISIKWIKAR
jgi:hypothetical protein